MEKRIKVLICIILAVIFLLLLSGNTVLYFFFKFLNEFQKERTKLSEKCIKTIFGILFYIHVNISFKFSICI